MTPARLRNIALFYVERFATTAANLRRVLGRRAARAARIHGQEGAELDIWIEHVVAELVKSGAVDDARNALSRAQTLRRLGRGPGKIRSLLLTKGVPAPLVREALARTEKTASGGEAALEAAIAYAKRRRLGPFRRAQGDAETRRKQRVKDLAALGRAGFSYDVAKRVMAMAAEEV
jgi:regulatory protein